VFVTRAGKTEWQRGQGDYDDGDTTRSGEPGIAEAKQPSRPRSAKHGDSKRVDATEKGLTKVAGHGEVVRAARRRFKEGDDGAGATTMVREAARWLSVCARTRRTRP
jgi:hypothetical protein